MKSRKTMTVGISIGLAMAGMIAVSSPAAAYTPPPTGCTLTVSAPAELAHNYGLNSVARAACNSYYGNRPVRMDGWMYSYGTVYGGNGENPTGYIKSMNIPYILGGFPSGPIPGTGYPSSPGCRPGAYWSDAIVQWNYNRASYKASFTYWYNCK